MKKLTALILSLTFVLALVGCSNVEDNKNKLIYGSTYDPNADNREYAVNGEGECLDLSDIEPTE